MIISKKNINTMANTVKKYVEKNKSIPSSINIDGVKYNYGQIAYILSYSVNYPGKPAQVIDVKNASKSVENSISENIQKDDYKDIAKRVFNYIKKNKKCPNYALTKKSKKKLSPRLFIYMLARIVVFYNNKNKLPNYAKVSSSYFSKKSSTVNNKLKSYMTTRGCSGMGQCTSYNCGPNSLQQCLYRLTGIKVSESTIAQVAGTTTSGTDHQGLNTVIAWFNRKYSKNVKIKWYNFSDIGWSKLEKFMTNGAVFCHIKYRRTSSFAGYGHYEVPYKISGDNIQVLNSLGDKCNSPAFCGYIENRKKSTQKYYIQGISQKSIAYLYI